MATHAAVYPLRALVSPKRSLR